MHLAKNSRENENSPDEYTWLDLQVIDFETYQPSLLLQLGMEETWSKICDFIEEIKRRVKVDLSSDCLFHGDLHWANVFYDDTTNEITFINVATLHTSIRKDPLGFEFNTLPRAIDDYQSSYPTFGI